MEARKRVSTDVVLPTAKGSQHVDKTLREPVDSIYSAPAALYVRRFLTSSHASRLAKLAYSSHLLSHRGTLLSPAGPAVTNVERHRRIVYRTLFTSSSDTREDQSQRRELDASVVDRVWDKGSNKLGSPRIETAR